MYHLTNAIQTLKDFIEFEGCICNKEKLREILNTESNIEFKEDYNSVRLLGVDFRSSNDYYFSENFSDE